MFGFRNSGGFTFYGFIKKPLQLIILIAMAVVIIACGGGGGSNGGDTGGGLDIENGSDSEEESGLEEGSEEGSEEEPEFEEGTQSENDPEGLKPFLHADMSYLSNHLSIPSSGTLSGLVPLLSLGETIIYASEGVDNGWASRMLSITIKDSDGIDGQYTCVPSDHVISTPDLPERSCFIRYENDSYAGWSESWGTSESSCTIDVIEANLGNTSIYEDFDVEINCLDMVNLYQFEDLIPAPVDADIYSPVSMTGRIYTSIESGTGSTGPELQQLTASLDITGGDSIVSPSLDFESIGGGLTFVGGIYFNTLQDDSGDYSLSIYVNAAYDVEGVFNCVSPPSVMGGAPALFVDNAECLVTIKKVDEANIFGWTWDSKDGAGCSLTVNQARNVSISLPLYDYQAILNCPGMQSQAITYGTRYPSDVQPADLNVYGSFNFIELL